MGIGASTSHLRDDRTGGVAACVEIALPVADTDLTVVGAKARDEALVAEFRSLVREPEEGAYGNADLHLAVPGVVLRLEVGLGPLRAVLQDVLNYVSPVAANGFVLANLLRLQATATVACTGRLGHGGLQSVGVRRRGERNRREHRWQA